MAGYDSTFSITKFGGINQSGDGYNTDLKYAQDGRNFNNILGDLTPYTKPVSMEDETAVACTSDKNHTLAFLTKRWTKGVSGIIPSDSYKSGYAVMVCDGRLFYKQMNNNSFFGQEWIELKNGTESYNFESDKFDTLTYEINYAPPIRFSASIAQSIHAGEAAYYTFDMDDYDYHEVIADSDSTAHYVKNDETQVPMTNLMNVRMGYDAPVDILLLTNADDGMYCVYAPLDGDILKAERITVMPNGTSQDIKFGCIERYCERIFGSGISTDPDKIMYCAPYDPFNWEQNNAIPDDGAGDIQQPNWDGDKFISLKEFSTSLLCIKEHAIWRISGHTPSEFSFKKMFGEGSVADGTVVTKGYFTYFLSDGGIRAFDGSGSNYVKYGYLHSLTDYLVANGTDAVAERYGDFYVLLCDTDYNSMGETHKRSLILYNTVESTFTVVDGDDIVALKEYKGELFALIKGSDSVGLYKLFDDTGDVMDVVWESAWIDLSAKNVTKSGFVVYLLLDSNEQLADGTIKYDKMPVPVTVSLITEKKKKEKQTTLYVNKPKKMNLNGNGRLYKVRLEIPATEDNIKWHMRSGIQMYVEFDYD